MDVSHPDNTSSPQRPRKKRIPKACGSCRQSKVKCDGKRPCTRCQGLRKVCTFTERPKDAYEVKIESLEKEIESLKARWQHPDTQLFPGRSDAATSSTPGPPGYDGYVGPGSASGHRRPGNATSDHHSSAQPSPTNLNPATYPETGSLAHPPGSVSPVAVTATRTHQPCSFPSPPCPPTAQQKRKRSHFEPGSAAVPDIVSAGLVAREDAERFYDVFFAGCDRYVPVFDPRRDTMPDVRSRSGLLFSTVCAVGCRVLNGTETRQWQRLSFHAQHMLNAAIATPEEARLETVQALLVRACYAPERSLLIAVATRMAIDLGLPAAYDTLTARLANSPRGRRHPQGGQYHPESGAGGSCAHGRPPHGTAEGSPGDGRDRDDDAALMCKTRTWLHLLVLSQILHVDAGDLPTFRFRGAARRCRILLDSPYSTDLDLYLFSQVELNALRAKIYTSLSRGGGASAAGANPNPNSDPDPNPDAEPEPGPNSDEELLALIGDAKIDIEVWHDDWARIYERDPGLARRMPYLLPNLSVQRCWADSMALCRAVRASSSSGAQNNNGNQHQHQHRHQHRHQNESENVDAMSPAQKRVLLMARDALRRHLDIVLEPPRLYLRGLRFAMDFVWAKNAFCFLLLLKLSVLLPEGESRASRWDLAGKGRTLLEEMTRASVGLLAAEEEEGEAGGFEADAGRNRTGTGAGAPGVDGRADLNALYIQLVRLSIDKYSQALREDGDGDDRSWRDVTMGGGTGTGTGTENPVSPSPVSHAHAQGQGQGQGLGAHGDLESFVPEQFVFEWDFPGLTLFSSRAADSAWLDEFLAGTWDGGDDFFGLGWASVDFPV